MLFRSALLAAALTLASQAAAVAGTPGMPEKTSQEGQPTQEQSRQNMTTPAAPGGVGLADPKMLGDKIRKQGAGQRHDAAKFQRLIALVREPQMSTAMVEQWASTGGGGAGMGVMPDDPAAVPPKPRMWDGKAPVASVPVVKFTSVSAIIGEDATALTTFVDAATANQERLKTLQGALKTNTTFISALNGGQVMAPMGAEMGVENIVAVEARPEGLEVYTIP
jgi:hypothetical protein